jgi:dipeptidase E
VGKDVRVDNLINDKMCFYFMRLYLSGGGSGEKSVELDRKFASAIGKSKTLLYIPIAMDENRHPYSECFQWLSRTFNPLGIDKIEMWTEKDLREKAEAELDRFSGVYVGGGNTFYLLKELRDSGFLPKLERLLKKNVPFYGGSAGAVIIGKTIAHAEFADPNDVKLKKFDAINLLGERDIWPHYEPSQDKEIQSYREKYNLDLIALPENAGVFVTEKAIEVVGPGSAYLPNKKMKEVKPGQKI